MQMSARLLSQSLRPTYRNFKPCYQAITLGRFPELSNGWNPHCFVAGQDEKSELKIERQLVRSRCQLRMSASTFVQ
jgi:hypothetical protein